MGRWRGVQFHGDQHGRRHQGGQQPTAGQGDDHLPALTILVVTFLRRLVKYLKELLGSVDRVKDNVVPVKSNAGDGEGGEEAE